MQLLYGIGALIVLAVILFVQIPSFEQAFKQHSKKTVTWLTITSVILLAAFLIFSILAMR